MNFNYFVEEIEKKKLKLEGLTVIKQGREAVSYRWVAESRRNVHSVSKSFASIAVGMAIDEGMLKLSDKVTEVFKREMPDTFWDSLTLEHLLTMNMGHPKFARPRVLEEVLSFELTRAPGTFFLYDNTCTFLISAMLTRATGLTMRDYLLERLFQPLGISDPFWNESQDGYTIGATGLFLTTSEMARFGSFLLDRGNWEGKQLVSASWIDRATRTQVATRPEQEKPDYDLGYGYHFWTSRHGAYRCDGKNGQFIIVFPGLDGVVAINSDEKRMGPILRAVWEHIFPVLQE